MPANKAILVGSLGKDPELLVGLDPESVAKRFWEKVKIQDLGCWEWKGALCRGYGIMSSIRNRSPFKAHRISWAIQNGKLEAGLVIRHTCDNPICVNPSHLVPGTQKDNADDMVSRGRMNKKSLLNLNRNGMTSEKARERKRCNLAKISNEIAENIRLLHSTGTDTKIISSKFNITERSVRNVLTQKTWRNAA